MELKNEGRGSLRLFAPAQPDLIAGDPINPKGVRLIKTDADDMVTSASLVEASGDEETEEVIS